MFWGLLICIVLLSVFALGELAVRGYLAYIGSRSLIEPGLYQSDAQLGWRLATNATVRQQDFDFEATYHTDRMGNRLTIAAFSKKHLRINVYGDSFAFGVGLQDDQTFPSVLGGGITVAQVINRGVSGYAPDQYLISFRQDLAQNDMRPDLAIFAILPANDMLDINLSSLSGTNGARKKPLLVGGDGRFEYVYPGGAAADYSGAGPQQLISPESGLDKASSVGGGQSMSVLAWVRKSELMKFLYHKFSSIRELPFVSSMSRKARSADVQMGDIAAAKARLQFVVAEVRKSGIPTVFILIPSKNLVMGGSGMSAEAARYAAANEVLEKAGVDFIDFRTKFSKDGSLYWPNEGHWTPKGARVVGEEIAKHLVTGYLRNIQ